MKLINKRYPPGKIPKFVVVVPFVDDKFLMIHQEGRGWEFPGGHIKEGESPEDAAKRETLEEAGAIIEDMQALGCLIDEDISGFVYIAKVKKLKKIGRVKRKLFNELPNNLSFSRRECEAILREAGWKRADFKR